MPLKPQWWLVPNASPPEDKLTLKFGRVIPTSAILNASTEHSHTLNILARWLHLRLLKHFKHISSGTSLSLMQINEGKVKVIQTHLWYNYDEHNEYEKGLLKNLSEANENNENEVFGKYQIAGKKVKFIPNKQYVNSFKVEYGGNTYWVANRAYVLALTIAQGTTAEDKLQKFKEVLDMYNTKICYSKA